MTLGQEEERDDAELLRLISHEEWIEAQQADPELGFVLDRLAKGVGPPNRDELSPCGRSAKFWCARWEQLALRDGRLEYRWEPDKPGEPLRWRVLVPPSLRRSVLTSLHDL